MKNPLFISLNPDHSLSQVLAKSLNLEQVELNYRTFPDGESYFQIKGMVKNQDIVLFADLSKPNEKLINLYLLSQALKNEGAAKICLIAPYLPYMRQDTAFNPGEVISARHIAKLISTCVDSIITVDPHLHRIHQLGDIFSIPATNVSAMPLIANWIKDHVPDGLIIGPDSESDQWVKLVSQTAGLPFTVLQKNRLGDRSVSIDDSHLKNIEHRRPILIDDIISTGRTMIETVKQLKQLSFNAPICIAVHALFVENAYLDLQAAGAEQIISCNSITHPSNTIDLSKLFTSLAACAKGLA